MTRRVSGPCPLGDWAPAQLDPEEPMTCLWFTATARPRPRPTSDYHTRLGWSCSTASSLLRESHRHSHARWGYARAEGESRIAHSKRS